MKPDIKKKIDVIAQKLPPYLNIAWFAVALISLIAPLFSSDVAKITDYVFRSYTTLYFIFFLWLSQKKPKLIFRIVFSLLIPAVWVSCFFNTPKPIAIAETPLFFLIFLSAFACFIKSGLDLGLLFNLIYFFVRLLSYSSHMKIFDTTLFTVIAAVDGILCTLLFIFMKKRKLLRINIKGSFGNAVAICLSVCIMSFVSYTLYKNINYAFDFSEPKLVTAVVEDKEIDFSAMGKKENYRLIVFVNDRTVSLKVTEDEYEFYSAGDKFAVKIYKGALGQNYYISSGWKQTNILVEKALENT